jgi:hypothetical protein
MPVNSHIILICVRASMRIPWQSNPDLTKELAASPGMRRSVQLFEPSAAKAATAAKAS